MIAMAKLPCEAEPAVLDVGAGYGFITEEVLRTFPRAHVTLQDFSDLMLARAREHLAKFAGQLSFVLADLTDREYERCIKARPLWHAVPRIGHLGDCGEKLAGAKAHDHFNKAP